MRERQPAAEPRPLHAERQILGIPSFNLPFRTCWPDRRGFPLPQNLPLFATQTQSAKLNAVTTNLGRLEAMNNDPSECGHHLADLLVCERVPFLGLTVCWCAARSASRPASRWMPHGLARLPNRSSRFHYDHRHTANLAALWDLGAIGGKSFNFVRDILANMIVSGVYTYQSGRRLRSPASMWDCSADRRRLRRDLPGDEPERSVQSSAGRGCSSRVAPIISA